MMYHATGVQEYMRCGEKYRLREIESAPPDFISAALLRGVIFHRTLEEGISSFDHIFNQTLKQKLPIRREEWLLNERDNLREMCVQYFRYLDRHDIDVMFREKTMNYKIGEREFEGTIDALAIHPDTPAKMIEIHDYKTGRMWPREAMDRNVQLANYFFMAGQNGYNVNRVFWGKASDLLPYKRDGKRAVKGDLRGRFLYEVKITVIDYPFVKRLNLEAVRGIESGVFMFNGALGPEPACVSCEFSVTKCEKFRSGFQSAANGFLVAQGLQKKMEEAIDARPTDK